MVTKAEALAELARRGIKQTAPVDQNAFRRAQDSLTAIDQGKAKTGFWNTGMVGGWTREIPGWGAYNLERHLDTLKARAAFDELQAMRKASPTGGALGGIAVEELKMLQAADASLDVGQPEAQLDANLDRMRASVVTRNPGLTAENPIDLSGGQSRATYPIGAYYTDPGGNLRRNDNGDRGNPIVRRSTSARGAGGGRPSLDDIFGGN